MDSHPLPSTGTAPRVLAVDDDRQFEEGLRQALEPAGYAFQLAAEGRQALREFNLQTFDIVLLDLTLADMDGLDVLTEMRKISAVPILILTARSTPRDIEMSFALGADDYIKKPVAPAQLIGRLAQHALPMAAEGLAVEQLRLWPDRQLLEKDGHTIMLTEVETKLLACLMARPDQPLSAATLFRATWPHTEASARQMLHMLETAVVQLQNKIGTEPKHPWLITAAQGGYRLHANPHRDMPP